MQHVPERADVLPRLLERLPPAVEVITDTEIESLGSNPMRNYLRCLTDPPPDATHLCVLQDDALPCRAFGVLVPEAVGERPDEVLSLFVGGLTNRTRKDFYIALQRRQQWTPVYFRDIHHVVALVWPVSLAKEFVAWFAATKVPGPIPPKSDDAVVGYWARTTKHQIWAHVPCLVQHPDDVPSLCRSIGVQGDKGRRAIYFIDE